MIILSGFFSSAETALTTVNQIRIRNLAEDGSRRARTVLHILESSDKMLSCILIGNNIVNLSASSLATTLTMAVWGEKSVSIATGILTLLILIFGEIMPKNSAKVNSEQLSLRYAPVVNVLMTVLTPVIFVINTLASGVMKLLRVDTEGGDSMITEDEIRTMVDVSHEEGETTGEERELINNVYDLTSRTASDIMVPRADMVSVSIDGSYEEIQSVFRREHFTRLPVYEGGRDHIVGILNIKDFCFVEDRAAFRPKNLMYDPYYTFETKKVADLMVEMRSTSSTLTIVLDEYGSAVGMITFEDLIEELVGEIRDEYDEDENDWIRRVDDASGESGVSHPADENADGAPAVYLIQGGVKLDDINEELGTDLDSEDYDSIGGYIIEHMGDQLPRIGDIVNTDDGLSLRVEAMKKRRITRVRLTMPQGSGKALPEDRQTPAGG